MCRRAMRETWQNRLMFLAALLLMQLTSCTVGRVRNRFEAISSIRPFCSHAEPDSDWLLCDTEADGSLRLGEGTAGVAVFASIDHVKTSDVTIYCTKHVSVGSAGPRSVEWEKMEVLVPIRIVIKIPFILGATAGLYRETEQSRLASTYKFGDERPVGPVSYLVVLNRNGDPHPIQAFGYVQEALDGAEVEDIIPLIFKDEVKAVGRYLGKLALHVKAEVVEAHKALGEPIADERRVDSAKTEMQQALYHVIREAQKGTLRILHLVSALFQTLENLWDAGLMHCDANLRNTMILKQPVEMAGTAAQWQDHPIYLFPKYEVEHQQGKVNLPEYFSLKHEFVRYIDMGMALELNPIIREIQSKYSGSYSSELLMPCALYRRAGFEDITILILRLADMIEQQEERLDRNIVIEARKACVDAAIQCELDLRGLSKPAAAVSSGRSRPGTRDSTRFAELLGRFEGHRKILARYMRSVGKKMRSALDETGCLKMHAKWTASSYQEGIVKAETPWEIVRKKLDTSPPNCSLYHMKLGIKRIRETVQKHIDDVNKFLVGESSTSTIRTTIATTASTVSKSSTTPTAISRTSTTTTSSTTCSTVSKSTTATTASTLTTTATAASTTIITTTTMTSTTTSAIASSTPRSNTVVEDTTTMSAEDKDEEEEEEEEEEGEAEDEQPEELPRDFRPAEPLPGGPMNTPRLRMPHGLFVAKDFVVVPLGGLVVIGAMGILVAAAQRDVQAHNGNSPLSQQEIPNVRLLAKEPGVMTPTPRARNDSVTSSVAFLRYIVSEPRQSMWMLDTLETQIFTRKGNGKAPGPNDWTRGIQVMRDTLLNGTHAGMVKGSDVVGCPKECNASERCAGYSFVTEGADQVFCVLFSAVWGRIRKPGYLSVVPVSSPILNLPPLSDSRDEWRNGSYVRGDTSLDGAYAGLIIDPDANACDNACRKAERCVGYTFVAERFGSVLCIMFSAVLGRYRKPGYTSAVPLSSLKSDLRPLDDNESNANSWEKGTYIMHDVLLTGTHAGLTIGHEAKHCQRACEAAIKCAGYTFVTESPGYVLCVLFSVVRGRYEKRGYTSVVPAASPVLGLWPSDEPAYRDYNDTVFETDWMNKTTTKAWGVRNRIFNGTVMAIGNTTRLDYCYEVCDANRCKHEACDDASNICMGVSYSSNEYNSRILCALYSAVWGYITVNGYSSVVAPPCQKSITTIASSSVAYDEWRPGQKVGKLEDTLLMGWWIWSWTINETQCFNSCPSHVCVGVSYKPIDVGIWCKKYTQIDGVDRTCHRLNWTSIIPPFKWMTVTTGQITDPPK